jgi:hypothetical protein
MLCPLSCFCSSKACLFALGEPPPPASPPPSSQPGLPWENPPQLPAWLSYMHFNEACPMPVFYLVEDFPRVVLEAEI